MAKRNPTPEDVELKKIDATVKSVDKACNTVLGCGLMVTATVCVAIVAWAAVRITDKPAWLTLMLAALGLVTPPSAVAWFVSVRLARRVGAARVANGKARGTDLSVPTEGEGGEVHPT